MPDGSEVTTQSEKWQFDFDPVAVSRATENKPGDAARGDTVSLSAFIPFEPPQLKAKYLEERDRRVRKDHGSQYQVIKSSKFAHWLQDPWNKLAEREVLDIETTVLILGGGFSGINTARQLKEAGVTDFKIMDTSADFGGTCWFPFGVWS